MINSIGSKLINLHINLEASMNIKSLVTSELLCIITAIKEAGGNCYLVGGCIRDAVLGKESKDIDIEVYNISHDDLVNVLSKFGKVNTVGKQFGVTKLTTESDDYDFAFPRRDNKVGVGYTGFTVEVDSNMSIEEAASRRDFTFNTLMYDVLEDELIDVFGGKQHLLDGKLVATSDKFAEDPLRVLRGMQFAARFNLEVDDKTAKLMASLLDEYSALSIERVWEEWYKWATKSVVPSKGIQVLIDSNWLSLLPELMAMKDVPQEPKWHPEGWNLEVISFNSLFTASTMPSTINSNTFGESVFTSITNSTRGKSIYTTTSTNSIDSFTVNGFTTTNRTWSFSCFFSSNLSPTIITKPSSFMQSFKVAGRTNKVVGIMFEVPFSSMYTIMQSSINDLKITNGVIKSIFIYVMNMLFSSQRSAYDQFHNVSMSPQTSSVRDNDLHISANVVDFIFNIVNNKIVFTIFVDFSYSDWNCILVHSSLANSINVLYPIIKVTQGEVLWHTMLVCDAMTNICKREGITGEDKAVLMFACLCHDMAKPSTTITVDGVIKSPGHEKAGEEPTRLFLASIGCPNRIIDRVVPLVVRHLAHLSCQSEKAVRRLAEALYPSTIVELGWVIEADQSGRPPIPSHMPEECKTMLEIAKNCNCSSGKALPLVTGKHLISLGVKPSKQMGEYLSKLFEAQLDGRFTSVDDGIEWFNTMIK